MERRGLVTRVAVEGDARGATVALTEKGLDVLRAAAPFHVASVRRHLVDVLSPSDVKALDRIATKVVDHLTALH
jgi:DNA-binding MarR family transcriptional regulator